MMAIMGASGAGKSTLLDAWSGLGWGEGFCLEGPLGGWAFGCSSRFGAMTWHDL